MQLYYVGLSVNASYKLICLYLNMVNFVYIFIIFVHIIVLYFYKMYFLLRKSLQSEIWLTWGLHIVQLYNKCRTSKDSNNSASATSGAINGSGNICSNMYPALLLPAKAIDFSCILQVPKIKTMTKNQIN